MNPSWRLPACVHRLLIAALCAAASIRASADSARFVASQTVAAGSVASLSAPASAAGSTYQWQLNGVSVAGATNATLTITNAQSAHAGIYTVVVSNSSGSVTSDPAVLGVTTTAKVIGAGAEIGPNILHPNGNTYDQVLLQGTAATITADPGQVTRISYVDLTDDIVQVEFAGAGSLSLTLDNPSGPAAPVNYNQAQNYMKGHATIVIAGANESTNVSVFSVGRLTAVDQSIFKGGITYEGIADLACVAILSPGGKFGGVRTANTVFFNTRGITGLFAPGIQFAGPVYIGDINGFDTSTAVIITGAVGDAQITGGSLAQSNGRPVQVSGLTQLKFVNGTTSHSVVLPAQLIQGQLLDNGIDVTAAVASSPSTLYLAYLRTAANVTNSAAYGTATIQLNPDEKSAFVNVGFANLSSSETVAHLVLDGNFVLGLPSGAVTQALWTFAPVGNYGSADLLAALKAGRITVSIDTSGHPTGELVGTFVRNTGGPFVPPPPPAAIDLSTVTSVDAARFLMQATFGATSADITDLVKKGYVAWLNEQMALPATPQRAYTMNDFATYNLGGQGTIVNGLYPYPGGVHRQAAWWKIALTAPDQLRQRVAFALSEIFVVSDQDANLNTWQEGLASYYDALVEDAFGNFRTLLEDVTLHPVMGVYLSALRNGRGAVDPNGFLLVAPNENYAREIMQLFTIGLNELNPDGTLLIDGDGQPIPTYDQRTIVETAKVFTGWAFYSTDSNRSFRTTGGDQPRDWTTPMMLYPEYHEDGAKKIIGGKVLPSGQGGTKDLKDTLDALFNHPNTGPFIARQLIQRLISSNPSPGYVYRVAQTFANNGSGVRGDLGAVVRAILLDSEARSPVLVASPGHGKLKEPLLRATAFLRAFSARSDSGRFNIDAYPALLQASLRAPTVFNFFQPDFARPGVLASAGLYAPEYQILTDTTAITMANFYDFYINNPRPALPSAENREAVYLQLYDFLSMARSPQALVDRLNLTLAAGTLSQTATDIIVGALNALPAEADDAQRVRLAIYLVVNAPEGATQK